MRSKAVFAFVYLCNSICLGFLFNAAILRGNSPVYVLLESSILQFPCTCVFRWYLVEIP